MEDYTKYVEMKVKEEPMDHQGSSSSHFPSSSGVDGVRSHSVDVKEEDVSVKDEPIEEVDPIAVNTTTFVNIATFVNNTTFTPNPESTWTEDSAQHGSKPHIAGGSTAPLHVATSVLPQEPAADQDDSGSDTDKAAKLEGNQLQRRWKNLRECFRRALKDQKGRSGDGAAKKRKYVYFDQLLFLAPTFNERETTGNYSAPEGNDEEEEREQGDTSSNSANVNNAQRPHKPRKIQGASNNRYEEELLEILRGKTKENCDEDTAFVMSLLPKFKKFNDEQRFEAQIEIMKVMRRVQVMTQIPSTAYHGNTPSTSTCQPYVAVPGMSLSTQRYLPTSGMHHMHQHQIREGHHSTQEFVHTPGYLHNQPYQPQLHHSQENREFQQSASNITTTASSPASEYSLNSGDTDLLELS